jgi:hypothetical protein
VGALAGNRGRRSETQSKKGHGSSRIPFRFFNDRERRALFVSTATAAGIPVLRLIALLAGVIALLSRFLVTGLLLLLLMACALFTFILMGALVTWIALIVL